MAEGVFRYKDDGPWYIRYEEPRGADGRRKQHIKACPGMTKRQAQELRRRIVSEIFAGTYCDPSSTLFGDYFEEWLTRRRQAGLSPTTIVGYRRYAKHHLLPALGKLRMDRIRPKHVQDLIDGLNSKLSAKTVRNVHGLVHKVLGDAVRLQMISRNPADVVEIPKKIRPNIRVATAEQLGMLIAAVEDSIYKVPILIAIGTGMRRGEILGLKWEDFDLERKTLAVRRSIVEAEGEIHIKGTKTDRVRVVAIPQTLVDVLIQHRKDQFAADLVTPWVCAAPDGSVRTPGSLDEGYRRLCKKIGFNVSLHGLRHTQATLLMAAGVPVKVISERLGHATVAMTMDVYSHVLPNIQAEAAEVVDVMMHGPSEAEAPGDEASSADNSQDLR